jgi:hypothetical protein
MVQNSAHQGCTGGMSPPAVHMWLKWFSYILFSYTARMGGGGDVSLRSYDYYLSPHLRVQMEGGGGWDLEVLI